MVRALFTNINSKSFFPSVFNDFFSNKWLMPQCNNASSATDGWKQSYVRCSSETNRRKYSTT